VLAGDRYACKERPGYATFWLYNGGPVLWIVLNCILSGWAQLNAVFEYVLAHARSSAFYDTVSIWQWWHIFGDVVFAVGAPRGRSCPLDDTRTGRLYRRRLADVYSSHRAKAAKT
jgi:hypothetical protein